jgi:hypothetical protein
MKIEKHRLFLRNKTFKIASGNNFLCVCVLEVFGRSTNPTSRSYWWARVLRKKWHWWFAGVLRRSIGRKLDQWWMKNRRATHQLEFYAVEMSWDANLKRVRLSIKDSAISFKPDWPHCNIVCCAKISPIASCIWEALLDVPLLYWSYSCRCKTTRIDSS